MEFPDQLRISWFLTDPAPWSVLGNVTTQAVVLCEVTDIILQTKPPVSVGVQWSGLTSFFAN
jgi:hypothetical protein